VRVVSFLHRGQQGSGELVGDVIRGRSEIPLSEVVLLPPVPHPKKILCIGINYEAHRIEMGREKPLHPVVFVRFATTLVGHEQAIVKPSESDRLDWEGELAVIIRERGRKVKAERALSIVAGYSCFDDASVRDWQRHGSQFTPGKNFDATGGFGPWMVTADEIPDPSGLELSTRVNGERVQHASTADMTFSVPELIEYISTFCTLEPGDVIATGTPSGVGDQRTPPRYLKEGDRVEVEIEKIGTLANAIENSKF
jgi:2-keto-4-pentenoate hydratase/2-oxohepta-3-ene-1,7-dioic acid hydratase in catechol pathway